MSRVERGRKVVVTGAGVLSPIGTGRENYSEALLRGKTGFTSVTLFDTSPLSVHIAGEISDFDPVALLGKKGLRSLDRSTLLLSAAAALALDDSGLDISEQDGHNTGVSVGTTFGSLHSISQFDRVGLTEGPRFVNPSHFPNTVINSPASQISIRFRIKGFNTTISTGFCAGLDAVAYAADFIKLGRADAALAGGVEELCEETFRGFHDVGLLSGLDGAQPVCCPFDARRNGVVLSEGAALLVLEEEEHAVGRKARILAEIAGCGTCFNPGPDRSFHAAAKGLEKAIGMALRDAGMVPQDIAYVSSCANSTRVLDRAETESLKAALGGRASCIPVSSIKSMAGETFSASGALSLAAACCAIERQFVPPTVNYLESDALCDLDYVPNEPRHQEVCSALVLSSDLFGNSTALVLRKYGGKNDS